MSRRGKRIRTEHLEVRWLASLFHHPRLGLIVPKHKHTAVARNRLKRRLLEVARVHLLPVLPPIDLVVRVRHSAYDLSPDALRRELVTAAAPLAAGPPPTP